MKSLMETLKPFVPPIAVNFVKSLGKGKFVGDFPTWDEAAKHASGDYSRILEGVKDALLRVKNGEGEFERDSVLIHEPQYNWPLLTMLLKVANEGHGSLSVLDFGGSLGTVYFQNRKFLASVKELKWRIVEQPSFVKVGREHFENDQLSFHCAIDEAVNGERPDLVLVSGVLQLLKEPYQVLGQLLKLGSRHVVIDRTPFITERGDDLLTVLKLPKEIHNASFPHWFFDRKKFMAFFAAAGYQLAFEFDGYRCDPANIKSAKYLALVFEKQAP